MSAKSPKFPPRPRSLAARKEHADAILARLAEVYPNSTCALNFNNPLELLISTVLSAQTTDVRVNSVTPELFATYPDARSFAEADREQLENILRPLGFFRSKATSLIKIGQSLVEKFDGEVPGSLDELVQLAGVGRKTANVVLGNAFGIPGITVDTHVGRLSRRFGFTRESDPVKVEKELARLWDEQDWTMTCHRIIDHGRQVCHARRPACEECPLADLCPATSLAPENR